MEKEDGGSAFPLGYPLKPLEQHIQGMTLRDYYAGQALMGFCQWKMTISNREISDCCWDLADEMIATRGKTKSR